jgi:hypothetical protein
LSMRTFSDTVRNDDGDDTPDREQKGEAGCCLA